MKRLSVCGVAALLSLCASVSAHAECGDITIANMSSQTAEALASIDQFILNKGFGCSAGLVAGDTVPGITSMIDKGRPEIIPEGATSVVPELVKRGIDSGAIIATIDPLSNSGEQGLWIPRYMLDQHPELAKIEGVLKHPELFPNAENPDKGAIYNGAPGWGATIVIAQLYKANHWDTANFTLVDPGSLAGLDSAISRAYETHKGIIAYYWAPTGLLGKYDMVKVDLGVRHDPQEWKRCTTVSDCPDPKPNTWPADNVKTLVSKRLVERGGPVLDYLRKRALDRASVRKLLAWMTDNQAPGDEAARHFLSENYALWSTWLTPDVAVKVKAAL